MTERVGNSLSKFEQFGRLSECELRATFDNFLITLQNKPESHGFVTVYNGVSVLPSNYDEYYIEKLLVNHIAMRGFDPSRITIRRGGFREELYTEMWIGPTGAKPRAPNKTVFAPQIPKGKTFLFDRRPVYFDFTSDVQHEFEIASVKAKREAEEAEAEAEFQKQTELDIVAEPQIDLENVEPTEEQYSYQRTAEEIESGRYGWISPNLGSFLQTRKDSTAVIMFYADDQAYDIGKIYLLVEQGRRRLAEASKIPPAKITVVFGGYRDSVETEFWIVPKKGNPPVPAPSARPVDDLAPIQQ